jgi:hypothetical protein
MFKRIMRGLSDALFGLALFSPLMGAVVSALALAFGGATESEAHAILFAGLLPIVPLSILASIAGDLGL